MKTVYRKLHCLFRKLSGNTFNIEETFKIPIFANKNIIDQTCNLRIEALEEFGYDSDPMEISFQTLKKSLPINILIPVKISVIENR